MAATKRKPAKKRSTVMTFLRKSKILALWQQSVLSQEG